MTVEAIKEEITHLSEPERKELTDWLEELEEQAWDDKIERDFAPGGRGAAWGERVKADITAGKFTSLEEGLRARREQRAKR